MNRATVLTAVGLAALVVGVGALSWLRRAPPTARAELLPYQARVADLPGVERVRHAEVRAALALAEATRAETQKWPSTFGVEGVTWVQRRHGLYVNYLGVPADPARLRWLVLVIEPEPTALKDPAPPPDDEHHTLADGTALHVTVWTAPNQGPVPEVVLPLPAAENWTQQLGK